MLQQLATGYVGLDLIKLLSKHPKVKIKQLCAKNIGKKFKNLTKQSKRVYQNYPAQISNMGKYCLLFTSLPNGEAQK